MHRRIPLCLARPLPLCTQARRGSARPPGPIRWLRQPPVYAPLRRGCASPHCVPFHLHAPSLSVGAGGTASPPAPCTVAVPAPTSRDTRPTPPRSACTTSTHTRAATIPGASTRTLPQPPLPRHATPPAATGTASTHAVNGERGMQGRGGMRAEEPRANGRGMRKGAAKGKHGRGRKGRGRTRVGSARVCEQ
jgi:hypothetical protein